MNCACTYLTAHLHTSFSNILQPICQLYFFIRTWIPYMSIKHIAGHARLTFYQMYTLIFQTYYKPLLYLNLSNIRSAHFYCFSNMLKPRRTLFFQTYYNTWALTVPVRFNAPVTDSRPRKSYSAQIFQYPEQMLGKFSIILYFNVDVGCNASYLIY